MFDVIVVGGGPAGLSAALMLGRCRRRVLVCDRGEPRNRHSRALHGYLTRDGIAPGDLTALGRRELEQYGVTVRAAGVTDAVRESDRFRVTMAGGGDEHARFLLLATGVIDALPGIPGFDDCYGRSIFHCPYCDGWEWRDRRLAAFGRGAAGARLALGLRTWSADVVACVEGGRLDPALRDRLAANGIAVRNSRVASVTHDHGMLSALALADGERLERDALFFATGQHPQSDLAIRLGCSVNRRGTIRTGLLCNTNVDGVFVAGDASRDAQFAIVAASEGVKAAVAINKALQHAELGS
jgi:thioredoxin reductase